MVTFRSIRAPRTLPVTRGAAVFRRACGILLAVLCALLSPDTMRAQTPASSFLAPLRVIDLNALRGNPFPNALTPRGIVVDQTRNMAFVSMQRTSGMPVFDINTGVSLRHLALASWAPGALVIRAINPSIWTLFAQPAEESPELLGISTIAGTVTSRYTTPGGGAVTGVAVDVARNRVFVADGTPVVRILDGPSLRVHDSIRMATGMNVGTIAFDSARAVLVVASSGLIGGRMMVQEYQGDKPHALYRGLSFKSGEPARRVLVHPSDRSMMLVTAARVFCVGSEGILDKEIRFAGGIADAALLASARRLFVVDSAGDGTDGLHRLSGRLHWIDLATFARDSLPVGHRARSIAVHESSGSLLLASENENRVLVLDGRTLSPRHSFDPGESAEALAWDPGRFALFAADALGDGNGIARIGGYQFQTLDMFRSGTRPVAIAFDHRLRRLFALDHEESAVSVFDVDDSSGRRSLLLPGVPEARSGETAHLAFDSASHLLLACAPESGRWTLIDGAAERVVRGGNVDGYTYAPGGGPGRLQGALAVPDDAFAVFRQPERILNVYRLSSGALLQIVDLSGLPWERTEKTDGELLYYDAQRRRVFAGPHAIDTRTWELTAEQLPVAARIIGASEDGTRLVGLAVDDSVRLTIHAAGDLRLLHAFSLYPASEGAPVACYVARGARLFLAEYQHARIREYALTGVTGIETEPPAAATGLSVAISPHPVPRGDGFTVLLTTDAPDAPRIGMVTLALHDLAGRLRAVRAVSDAGGGARMYRMETRGIAPGVYVLTASDGVRFARCRVLVAP
ncbi:MAG: hypothetical protein IPP94_18795 [Ignavibacteria bacterium]|nr:hypothetical protein [Ignavibacteria bacterium]